MTTSTKVDVDAKDLEAEEEGEGAPPEPAPRRLRWQRPDAGVLGPGLTILPLVVAFVVLIFTVGGDYHPVSDEALTELQTRDVGVHEVLVGLYSRADWNHPGPLLFYALAPFYRLAGGASIGMNLGTLVINGAAILGMALLARRRGGTPLMLLTLLASALLMRTLSAPFLNDPWNTYVTALPFGLMIFAAWCVACGDRKVLPVAVATAAFLAQTHVGFVALALPMLAWGTAWLVAPVLRRDADAQRRREVIRSLVVSAVVGVVLWLPVGIDMLVNRPSNMRKIVRWFKAGDDKTQSWTEGWRVITGQFSWTPEWLHTKKFFAFGTGESPFMYHSPPPWLLLIVGAAAIYLWRTQSEQRSDARRLILTLGLTLLLGIVAVKQTVGDAYDYRLRWTWLPAMVAFVLVLWAGWQGVTRRWPSAERLVLAPAACLALVVVSGVNVYTAATDAEPFAEDSDIIASLMPGIREELDKDGGQIVVEDPFAVGAWFQRGLVVQLEREGYDARVYKNEEFLFGSRRVVDPDDPVQAHLVVMTNDGIKTLEEDPDLEVISRWKVDTGITPEQARRKQELMDELYRGELGDVEFFEEIGKLNLPPPPEYTMAAEVAVFMDRTPGE